ncbi:MAG: alanine:cation symporter family protein [Methanocalculaceae archaeon]|jgi:amino acid carrier protein|nr:alanine:cation symporter family protein [Methanocalculaceae archaeon]
MSVFDAINSAAGEFLTLINMDQTFWPIVIVVLFCVGLYFTIRTGGVQFTMLKESCRQAFGSIKLSDVTGKSKSVSSFQAFAVSMGARVGIGNIAGVAAALVLGGPGAVFWMWLFAILGAATSFVECTVGQIYKEKDAGGHFNGGPAYYIKNALGSKDIACVVALLVIIAYPFLFTGMQASTITSAFTSATGLDQWIIAVVVTLITAAIIFGGIHRVAKVSSALVPFMAVLYLVLAAVLILLNITKVPEMFVTIFSYAFGLQAFAGGAIGTVIMQGVRRGMFSNEAGIGSIPNVVSSAKIKHPVKQGLIQSLGVYVDTLIVCSATAFVILLCAGDSFISYMEYGTTKAVLVQDILATTFLGGIAPMLIAVIILFFAFSSMISYYFMGETNTRFLTKNKHALTVFRVLVVLLVLIACLISIDTVWDLGDLFMGIMALFNLSALIFICKYAFEALKDYKKQRAAGIEEPIFDPSILSNTTGITCWPDNEPEQKDEK